MSNNENITYRISETGICSRALAAVKLGNNPTPETSEDRARLNYYAALENLCAQKLVDLGLEILPGVQAQLCNICKHKYNSDRYGIHVEIKTDLIDFIGHLDRRVQLKGGLYPLEIKCLGRFGWQKFVKDNFKSYPSYAAPESCYLEAEKKPGLYVCMNRDTGDLAKYTINDKDKEIRLDGFTNIDLPTTFEQVVDKLVNIEIEVSNGTMPQGEESDGCIWCHYKYLCSKDTDLGVIDNKKTKLVTIPGVVEAAEMYKDAVMYEKIGKDGKATATFALLEHAKQNSLDKYRVSGVSVSYRGQTTRKWYDNKVLEELVDKKILKKAERQSEPYDSFTIRILKEKDETEQ